MRDKEISSGFWAANGDVTAEYEVGAGMRVLCVWVRRTEKSLSLSLSCERVGREQRASERAFLSICCAKITRLLLASDGVALPFYLPGFILCWAPFCEYEITTRSPWQLHAFVTLVGKKLAAALLGGALLPAAAHVSALRLAPLDLLFRLTVGEYPPAR